MGEGTPGSPRDPMGGGPGPPIGGEPLGANGRGPLGPPLGAHLKVFCKEVTFKKITKNMQIEFSDV